MTNDQFYAQDGINRISDPLYKQNNAQIRYIYSSHSTALEFCPMDTKGMLRIELTSIIMVLTRAN